MVYFILSILWKNSNPEHARKNCKVLRVVYTQERIIFYYPHGTYVCFRGLLIENNCFKMEWVLLLFLCGTKSSENNRPNAQPAQCKTPSECYKIRYIRRYWPATNWILCLGFCCGSTVCHWWRFFNYSLISRSGSGTGHYLYLDLGRESWTSNQHLENRNFTSV